MTLVLALITLMVSPWHGASLPTASPAAVKYRLTVYGPAEQYVNLRAQGLPSGWVASFCTKTLCSPFQYRMELSERGMGVIEFQAIRTDERAPSHAEVTVTTDGAKPLRIRV